MPYEFPDNDTLAAHLALLRDAILEAKAALGEDPARALQILDAVHNVPDLVTRWPDMREDWLLSDLERYEQQHLAEPRFSRILKEGPPTDWRLTRTYPKADEWVDPNRLIRSLVDRWCGRRELAPLVRLLPAVLAHNGLTDGWQALRAGVRDTIASCGDLPEQELAELRQAERLVDQVLER